MIFESIDALEDSVMEVLFTQLVPDVFLGIELGRVRRKKRQAKVVGQVEVVALVPASAIEHHQDVVVGVASGDFVEEELHAVGVDMGQHQAVEATVLWTHGTIGVGVLLRDHGADQWP